LSPRTAKQNKTTTTKTKTKQKQNSKATFCLEYGHLILVFSSVRHTNQNDLDFLKIQASQTGGVAQEVEHLFCKCETLSSNSSANKQTNKKFKPLIDNTE
jgi:hypothetical protein